ncbi:aladin-like [Macrobrachium rosenbergii]|uniref:aladin-like n=1 Tax=Macrobrachium rosenbergii TaxID=79674 RepID=UPI0034D540E0
MISLEHLMPPPPCGIITSYESHGHLYSAEPSEAVVTTKNWLGQQFVEVTVGQEPVRTAHSKQEARDAFYAHKETAWQRVMFAYYEEGWEATLKEIMDSRTDGRILQAASRIASFTLKLLKVVSKVQELFPSPKRSISSATSLAHGTGGSIVSVAWHPHTCTLAAVFCDDTVRVFSASYSITPLLKHRLQKSVTQIAWMPYSASQLAVGCEGGILLWTLDPVNVVTRPSGSCVMLLSHPSTTPVNALSWHPKGNLLACVGDSSSVLLVWDVGREVSEVAHCGRQDSISIVLWSPDGSRVFVGYASKTMRVFETQNWSYEWWSLDSPVQSAVWSANGHVLLFVTQEEPVLFCIGFIDGEGVGGAKVAAQVADFTTKEVTIDSSENVIVGGAVRQLAWDPRSERLAVIFRQTEFIALFHTSFQPSLHLAPGGFVRGEMGQVPVTASFRQNLSSGAVLSVVWSSGQVQHIPMRYASLGVVRPTNIAPSNILSPHINPNVSFNTSSSANISLVHRVPSLPTSPLVAGLFTSP